MISPIEHLAMICCGVSGNWRKVLMGMTAVFDASGSEAETLITVVAGFFSSAQDWVEFSEKWIQRLNQDGIAYMHMKEFAHSRGQFSQGWEGNKKRRETFLFDLMELIRSHAYRKFGIVVTNKALKHTLSPETQKNWHLNAYSLAGRSCALQSNEWAIENKYNSPIKLVFEKGDLGAGKLHDRLVEDGYQAPSFEPKKDERTPQGILIPAFVPLQAADFLAYELYLEVERITKGDILHPKRWALIEFDKMLGYIGTWKEDDLKRFESMANLPKALDDWAIDRGFLARDSSGKLYTPLPLCELKIFKWSWASPDPGHPKPLPICIHHKRAQILLNKCDEQMTAICKPDDGDEHILGTCSYEEFKNEEAVARSNLENRLNGEMKL